MLQNSSILKIGEIFFNEPTKFHYLIEISKKSKIAHTSTKKYLTTLKKEGIIKEKIDKRGKRIFPSYIANLDDSAYRMNKKLHNLSKIYYSGIVASLKEKIMPKSIILFGSYNRGEDIESSDIDIFVEAKKQDINLQQFEKKLKRKIELHFNENFNNYPNELKNNIANGYVLYGYLEVFK
jgi:predicted nucleotidyltransferase